MNNKRALKKFLKENKNEVELLAKNFSVLFNKCGAKTKDGSVQLALTGTIFYLFLDGSDLPKKEKLLLLKNVEKQFSE